MGIMKRIVTSYAEMAQFIEDSGFFGNVTYDDSRPLVTCKDSSGNTVFTVGAIGTATLWTGYADASNSVYEQISSVACTAYSTAKGLMFMHTGQYDGAPCIASKTNNNQYCVLLPTDNKAVWSSSVYLAASQKAIAWGDVAPFTNLVNSGAIITGQTNNIPSMETANQTIFSPIATHSDFGVASYFADAFFLPISQYRNETVFVANGIRYITDGFACLEDTEI